MRASERLLRIPRSGIRRVLERPTAANSVSLAAGDPDLATPPHIVAAASEAMLSGMTHYTHGKGLMELRRAFARKLAVENNMPGVNPEREIVVTVGALNALSATFLALVNPGDQVIIPDPSFANYAAQVSLAGGTVVPLRAGHSTGFQPDLAQLEQVAATAKILIINSPGNPTGVVLDREMLTNISEIAIRHDLFVIADEAYEHLVFDDHPHVSMASLPGMAERTMTIHSMSKSWSMTGWRIGFATGPADLIEQVAKVQEHLVGCPPAMTQWGALAALEGSTTPRNEMVANYARRRLLVLEALADVPGLDLVRPDGAFYAFPRFTIGLEGYELAEAVADGAGVVTIPGVAFGKAGASHLRISYAVPDAQLLAGLEKLTAWLVATTEVGSTVKRSGGAR